MENHYQIITLYTLNLLCCMQLYLSKTEKLITSSLLTCLNQNFYLLLYECYGVSYLWCVVINC